MMTQTVADGSAWMILYAWSLSASFLILTPLQMMICASGGISVPRRLNTSAPIASFRSRMQAEATLSDRTWTFKSTLPPFALLPPTHTTVAGNEFRLTAPGWHWSWSWSWDEAFPPFSFPFPPPPPPRPLLLLLFLPFAFACGEFAFAFAFDVVGFEVEDSGTGCEGAPGLPRSMSGEERESVWGGWMDG